MFIVPWPLAPTGAKAASASKTRSATRLEVSTLPPTTAAGGLRVEQRSLRGAHRDRPPGAGRGRRVRVADDAHRVEAGRLGHRQRAVEVALDLLGAAVEVELQGIAADRGAQAQRDVAVESLEHVLGRALAVGHLIQRGAGPPLGVVEDLGGRRAQQLDSRAARPAGGACGSRSGWRRAARAGRRAAARGCASARRGPRAPRRPRGSAGSRRPPRRASPRAPACRPGWGRRCRRGGHGSRRSRAALLARRSARSG